MWFRFKRISVNQGLGEISFSEHVFMNSLGDGKQKGLTKFADNRKGGASVVPKSSKRLLKLKLHEKNRRVFNKEKHKVLHLARRNQLLRCRMGNNCLGGQERERIPGL